MKNMEKLYVLYTSNYDTKKIYSTVHTDTQILDQN